MIERAYETSPTAKRYSDDAACSPGGTHSHRWGSLSHSLLNFDSNEFPICDPVVLDHRIADWKFVYIKV